LQEFGFPADKYLAAGIIDGRNVWRADLKETEAKIDVLRNLVSDDKLIIQPSSSLLHVPVTKTLETKIDPVILEGLSFADEKLIQKKCLLKKQLKHLKTLNKNIVLISQLQQK